MTVTSNFQARLSIGKECNCRQKSNCPLAAKCLSKCLVYYAHVDTSDINQTKSYHSAYEKISRRVTTTILLLLEIKEKKKEQNSQNISGR